MSTSFTQSVKNITIMFGRNVDIRANTRVEFAILMQDSLLSRYPRHESAFER